MGIMLGLAGGLTLLGGGGDKSANDSLAYQFDSGYGIGFDGGLRFARDFYVGVALHYDKLSPGTKGVVTGGGGGFQGALMLAWLGNGNAFGFYLEGGVAYRTLGFETTQTVGGNIYTFANSLSGVDGILGIGFHFRGGPIHIIPKISLSIGKFSGGTVGTAGGDITYDATNEAVHVVALFGIQGAYDIPLGATPAASGASVSGTVQ
jgi:hypothetical protein